MPAAAAISTVLCLAFPLANLAAETEAETEPLTSPCCRIVELRQYTLHPHQRDVLIELFEKELVEPQRRAGAEVLGQFRDLDDPDRFVWLRGFDSMEARTRALTAFYYGAVWKQHRQAANVTMLDSDNVLLLHPVAPEGGFASRSDRGGSGSKSVVTATIHYVASDQLSAFAAFFAKRLRPSAEALGADVLATFESETSLNSFPQLPIRAHDSVFIWFARFSDEGAADAFFRRLHAVPGWREGAPEHLLPALMRKPEVLRLRPTEQSWLR
jgi:hypothetical protein